MTLMKDIGRMVLGVGALLAALIMVLAFAGVAQAQLPYDDPYYVEGRSRTPSVETEHTTIDGVRVDVIERPRSFVAMARANRPSTNRLSYVITATCRVVPVGGSPANTAFTVTYTDPLYPNFPDEITFCDEGERTVRSGRPIGTTWNESKSVTRVFKVWESTFRTVDYSTEVSWKNETLFLGVDVTRVKRFHTWKTRTIPHRGSYVVRAYADTNYDRYWNICVVQNIRVYSSGGRLYCRVRYSNSWTESKRVRVLDRTRVKWSVSGMSDFDGAVLPANPEPAP